jgi:hypothetical protein
MSTFPNRSGVSSMWWRQIDVPKTEWPLRHVQVSVSIIFDPTPYHLPSRIYTTRNTKQSQVVDGWWTRQRLKWTACVQLLSEWGRRWTCTNIWAPSSMMFELAQNGLSCRWFSKSLTWADQCIHWLIRGGRLTNRQRKISLYERQIRVWQRNWGKMPARASAHERILTLGSLLTPIENT